MNTQLKTGKGLLPFPILFWIWWKLDHKPFAIAAHKVSFRPLTVAFLSGVLLSACYSESNELSPVGFGAGTAFTRPAAKPEGTVLAPPVAPIQQSQYDREDYVPAKTMKEALEMCDKLAEELKKETGKTYINWNVKKGLKGGYYCQMREVKP